MLVYSKSKAHSDFNMKSNYYFQELFQNFLPFKFKNKIANFFEGERNGLTTLFSIWNITPIFITRKVKCLYYSAIILYFLVNSIFCLCWHSLRLEICFITEPCDAAPYDGWIVLLLGCRCYRSNGRKLSLVNIPQII